MCDWNLYKTPSDEILRHRKELYNLWRRIDDQTATWLNRVQRQIDRCDFPPLISREFLLIDRFVCDLNANAREFIQSVDTWTLDQLNEYFADQNIVTDRRVNVTISIDTTFDQKNQQTPSVECEFVSYSFVCIVYSFAYRHDSHLCILGLLLFQNDVDSVDTFIQIKSESSSVAEEDQSTVYSLIDIESEISTGKSKSDYDIIDEMSVDGSQCELVSPFPVVVVYSFN